jgi:predicted homoserine dehydrogenase-like protein
MLADARAQESSNMNLAKLLKKRAESGQPVRIGVIGAGKFASMFLAQARTTTGLHLLGLADLSVERANAALGRTGWDTGAQVARDFDDARKSGRTVVTDDAEALIAAGPDVVIDITGNPAAAIRHILKAFAQGCHVVNVTVEADALCGALLAARARAAGVVYSMAYGDQPALVCEMVDWAEATGIRVVAAGKGTKYLAGYHQSTPDTVWSHFGITPEHAQAAGMNSQMFNSFVDGTKSAIEMAAISNATGLNAPRDGLAFPPCGHHDLPLVLRPRAHGGALEERGLVEVVSSMERDGRPVANDLRWGVYVVFEAGSEDARADYTRGCFRDYAMIRDAENRYAAMYRSHHLVGMELGISIAAAALRGEATGTPHEFRSDVVATAKKPLKAGDVLDGEGGYCVYGKLMRAEDSVAIGALPIGLAHKIKVTQPVAAGAVLRWSDVAIAEDETVRLRREMESKFAPPLAARTAAE